MADGAVRPGLVLLLRGATGRFVADLDPGYFAWVMASGIVSIGADLLGYPVLSQVVLGFTVVAFLVLVPAYVARAVMFGDRFRESLADPQAAMAYFTVVAGTDVLATRLLAAAPDLALGLSAVAAVLWLLLTYGLPPSLIGAARRPVLGQFNGTWLVWVVATQSLAIVAAGLSVRAPGRALRDALPEVAVALWGVGVMLYLILIVIICMRLLLVDMTPQEMGPAYWIAMGATAISVRAAAGILDMGGGAGGGVVREMHPVLVGLSVVLWAFGTWWIPMLVLFGFWRHVLRRYPIGYEPRLWSVVFPLGMYTVASYSLGGAAGLPFLRDVADAWIWVGLASWLMVQLAMAIKEGRGARAALAGRVGRAGRVSR